MSSGDAEVDCEAARIAAHNRVHSPLLSLPGELRNKILSFAVGRHTIVVEDWRRLTSPGTRLIFRLATANKLKRTINGHGIGDGSRYDVNDSQSEANGQNAETKRVSQIFIVTRVCRQLHTETALSQYPNNCFHFSTPYGLEAFTKQVTPGQRRAITAISIDCSYVLSKILGSFNSFASLNLPTAISISDIRHMLLSLGKIYVKPEALPKPTGATGKERLLRFVKMLGIDDEKDGDLWIGCFDVHDENVVLKDVCGFSIKSAGGGEANVSVASLF